MTDYLTAKLVEFAGRDFAPDQYVRFGMASLSRMPLAPAAP